MWRPKKGWKNPYAPKASKQIKTEHQLIFEEGADAILKSIWALAEESPTGTFTLDSKIQYL